MDQQLACDSEPDRARRALLLLAAFAALAAVVATLLVVHARPPLARAERITLIYVGAEDCAPCRAWQNGDGAKFRRSAHFARIAYVEVKANTLRDILADAYWPEPIRPYRSHIRQSDGVPLWLIVSNGRVTERRSGPTAWRSVMLPAIRSVGRQGRFRQVTPLQQASWAAISR